MGSFPPLVRMRPATYVATESRRPALGPMPGLLWKSVDSEIQTQKETMTSFNVLRNFTSIALTALCAIGVSNAGAQVAAPLYTLTDLGVLPNQKDNSSKPAALNNQTQVTGTAGTSAFRYTKDGKGMEDLGKESFDSIARGFGINSLGVVAGDSTFGKTPASHAAIFANGTAVDLGTLKKAGPFSRANGINASSQVVGFAGDGRDSQNSRAFIIDVTSRFSRMIDLGTLGGQYAQAWGINDLGFVTGNAQTTDQLNTDQPRHAFIWDAKTGMLDLGTIAGDSSYGTSINRNNHVAGYSTLDADNNRIHAFLYDGKKMIDLGSLSGAALGLDYSYAFGINANDQVVGYSYLPSDGPWSVAFVYRNGLMMNLNDLIGDASKNYRLDCATGINDKGEIVVIAYDNSAEAYHAVLLTPASSVPPRQ
jgi:probable HAF family extracellular repeat protein